MNLHAIHQPVKACTYLGPDYDSYTSRISPAPYCGCVDIHEGSSFCNEHYPIVYNEGTANRKRKKDIKRAEAIWTLESLFHEVIAELESEGVDFD